MTIDDFQEKMLRIRPNNFMGLDGAAAGIVGSASSGSDAVMNLQRAAIDFARLYKTADDETSLRASSKEVMAKIMVAHTLDVLSEQQADELIDALQQLMDEWKLQA